MPARLGAGGPGRANEDSPWYRVLGAGALSSSLSCLSPAGLVNPCILGGSAADTHFLVLLTPPSCPRVTAQLSVRGRAAGLAVCWERVRNSGVSLPALHGSSAHFLIPLPGDGLALQGRLSAGRVPSPDQRTCGVPVTAGCTGHCLLSSWVALTAQGWFPCDFTTPRAIARQTPLSMGFPRQEYWRGLPFPSPGDLPSREIK